jgi:predicted nucleic acid-binding protein
MAEIEGIRPLGTLGFLLRAARRKQISTREARRLVDLLVGTHGVRIGVAVYQSVLAELTRSVCESATRDQSTSGADQLEESC